MFDVTIINTYLDQITQYINLVIGYFSQLSSSGSILNETDPKIINLCLKYSVTTPSLPTFAPPDYTYFVPDSTLVYDPLDGIDACQVTISSISSAISSIVSQVSEIVKTAATTAIDFIMKQIDTFSTFVSDAKVKIEKWWDDFKKNYKKSFADTKSEFIKKVKKTNMYRNVSKLNDIWNDRAKIYADALDILDTIWKQIIGVFESICDTITTMANTIKENFKDWMKDYRCLQKTFMDV